MNILETQWWTAALPPEWWAESEDQTILIGDRDDVGCIEITTLHKESGEFAAEEVARIATAESEADAHWQRITLGDFAGVTSSFVEDESAVREWFVASGAVLLYITYSCDAQNSGLDDAAVDELLDTLLEQPAS